jgi:homoserine dehydrogenase
MAFGKRIDPNTILCEGITSVTAADSALAKDLGYAIKLIGYTVKVNGKILAMVSPRLVPRDNPIYGISYVNNGILVTADMVGQVMFYGPGAGKLPTASAVAGDLIDVMGHTPAHIHAPVWVDADPSELADPEDYVCRHLVVLDAPAEAEAEIAKQFKLNAVRYGEGRFSFITEELSEAAVKAGIAAVGYPLVSRIRVLG